MATCVKLLLFSHLATLLASLRLWQQVPCSSLCESLSQFLLCNISNHWMFPSFLFPFYEREYLETFDLRSPYHNVIFFL